MSEIERLLHLFVSLQFLFGSRRGGFLVPLLILGLIVGGWFAYRSYFSAEANLEKADIKWDSGETSQRISAIRDYKIIMRRRDELEPQLPWLKPSRERSRLYRRIIEHHVLFDIDEPEARDWIHSAWSENIRDLDFHDDKVNVFWKNVVDEIKAKQKSLGPLGGVLQGS
ncbi:MAG: hypothetical protein R3C03_13985 [Pirellulaceae bacterium]